jgi:thioredoxin reductase
MDSRQSKTDVVVIGGGAAGLSGALMLARSRRRVTVVDAGEPRNAPAEAVHGLLARDGTTPHDLLAAGRDEVRRYGGAVIQGRVVRVDATGPDRDGDGPGGAGPDGQRVGFRVTLADGTVLDTRRVLVATGVVDELPDIPGLSERWGRDVIHCPYCHGWEVRDQAVGVLASPGRAVHQALLFRQLSRDVVVFTDRVGLTAAERERLTARDIRIVEGEIVGVHTDNDRLSGIRLADGQVIARRALVLAPRQVVKADLLAGLGLRPVEHPSGSGQHLAADPMGRSSVPGVWLAGNVTDPFAQVGAAAANGAMAGAQINAELVAEEADAALAALRDPFSAASEARVSELVTGVGRHGM